MDTKPHIDIFFLILNPWRILFIGFFWGQVNSELRKQNIQIRFLLFHSIINRTRCDEKSEGQTVEMSKFSLVNGSGVKMSNSFRDGNRILLSELFIPN